MSISQGSYEAAFIPGSDSDIVRTSVTALLRPDAPDLVERSQAMARALHDAETGSTSSGLFVVGVGTRRQDRMVAVIKLEKEEGVRVARSDVGGKTALSFIVERELVMTQNTKVFKCGVFCLASTATEQDQAEPEIWVSDRQTGVHSTRAVADFFLRVFLGCQTLRSPDLDTAAYFDAVESWVNANVADPVRRTAYQQALIADMNSHTALIRPGEFRQTHINEEDRTPLRNALRSVGLDRNIRRDTARIENRIKQVAFNFESGVRVLATQAQYDEVIELDLADADRARLTINDRLKAVRGSS
jgi:hypothetical protein